MDNIFTGSKGLFRFRIVPEVVMATPKEVNYEAGPYECASAGFYLHMETIYEQAGGNSALAAQLLRPRHPRGGRLSPHLAIYRPESRPLGGG